MKFKSKVSFDNGVVYLLETDGGLPVEVTDTYLPYYTKDAIGKNQNALTDYDTGSRDDRWMIGVSVMSGCPVGCKFCATGRLAKCRNLSAEEITEQVDFILSKNPGRNPELSKEFKINYTRMGEPFLNISNVKSAVEAMDARFRNVHHYISTVGISGSDFSFIKDNITLQFSIHSFRESKRNWLIPFRHKMTMEEMGAVRTKSHLKTTLNLTLIESADFCINRLKEWFPGDYFFVKLSPVNPNDISDMNGIDTGIVKQLNIL